MLDKFVLLAVSAVGGVASITGTLPAVMIALFGNPSYLSPKPSASSNGAAAGPAYLKFLNSLFPFDAPGTNIKLPIPIP